MSQGEPYFGIFYAVCYEEYLEVFRRFISNNCMCSSNVIAIVIELRSPSFFIFLS